MYQRGCFSDGMPYAVFSRDEMSLEGLHLTVFNQKSIRASVNSLREINLLWEIYRKDVPLYNIPAEFASTKSQLTGICDDWKPLPSNKSRKSISKGKQGGTGGL